MEKVEFEVRKPTPFPQALFKFSDYNGVKAVVAVIFLFFCLYFLGGLFTFFNWTNKWWQPDLIIKLLFLSYHIILFTIAYCFTWLVFDKRGIEGYALSVFSTILGIVYIGTPIDFIPEIIPVVGTLDDVVVGGGSIILGIYSWLKNNKRRRISGRISKLIDQNSYEDALELFLRNEGYFVKRLEDRESSSDVEGSHMAIEKSPQMLALDNNSKHNKSPMS